MNTTSESLKIDLLINDSTIKRLLKNKGDFSSLSVFNKLPSKLKKVTQKPSI
jgi:hypothetical protein